MTTNEKIAEQLEQTAKRLLARAKALRSGAPLKEHECKHMTALKELVRENYPCKGYKIKCGHPEVGEQASIAMSTKLCNSQNCKFYQQNINKSYSI